MAGFFARFGKRWGSNGTITNPTDAEAATGWAHLANGKPTVERFNAVGQWSDEKDNWLFAQLAAVMARAGRSFVEAGDMQLADALRVLLSTQPVVFAAAGTASYVPGSQTAIVLAAATGGGGGATGCNSRLTCGAGGGAGGTAIGIFAVTPGSAVTVTVGAAGTAGGNSGGNGGTSAFGTFCSGDGGFGGGRVDPENIDGGLGGRATGGLFNLKGGDGGDGHTTGQRFGSGHGGAAFLGASRRSGIFGSSATGQDGANPGDGGAAPYWNTVGNNGGRGAAGRVIVWPLA